MKRALSFGSDAETYHRLRPGYPAGLVDVVVSHAEGPVRRALEVGAGTGKATTVFAARGLRVTAIEPDPGMRAVLASEVAADGWDVEIVDASFESFDLAGTGHVDLLLAAAAFHWTDPATRWSRAAAALRPGGVLALFGAARDLADPDLRAGVDALTGPVLADDPSLSWTLDTVRSQPGLTAVVETTLSRTSTMSADDYVAFLTTVSAYRILEEGVRDDLLAAVRDLLPDTVEVADDVPLQLARRDDRPVA